VSTQTAREPTHIVGQPLRRKEDARIITGQARWTDNLAMPGLLHIAIALSPVAHARIGGTDISAALRQPGVVAAFTGADLAGDYGSLPTAWHVSDDLIVPDHRPVVADEARYLGDAVAVVVAVAVAVAVAEEPYQAADGRRASLRLAGARRLLRTVRDVPRGTAGSGSGWATRHRGGGGPGRRPHRCR
jgi:CO/xanthine dehydrogenase Mo-binding subunit